LNKNVVFKTIQINWKAIKKTIQRSTETLVLFNTVVYSIENTPNIANEKNAKTLE